MTMHKQRWMQMKQLKTLNKEATLMEVTHITESISCKKINKTTGCAWNFKPSLKSSNHYHFMQQ